MMAQEIRLVSGQSVGEFTTNVNDLLSAGWKLSGGPSVIFNPMSYTTTFYQAVYREFEQPGAWG